MKLLSIDIDEMTHDQLATACHRDGDPELLSMGAELREAVDNEQPSAEIAERIESYLSARD